MKNYSSDARKITIVLLITQSLGAAAFSVVATVNTIVGEKLSGITELAGVPGAALQLGSALAALLLGVTMDRTGRRLGLGIGLGFGILGGTLSALAVVSGSFGLLLGGMALFGIARAAQQMSRFAAAEIYRPEFRGRAISYIILGSVVGSVLGPQLAAPAGNLVRRAQLDELVGPFLVGLTAFGLASLVILLLLKPDPRDIGREIAEKYPETVIHQGPTRSLRRIFRTPAVIVAVIAMVFGQLIMVGLMGITSLHMMGHEHGLANISIVFSSHTLGMFAFSVLTGRLTDSWGRAPVILTGSGILIAASAVAPLSPDLIPLSVALFLLGLGWNFCYVGGSALLSDQLSPEERARTQGVNDLMIGLATALASLGSGAIFAWNGYAALGMIGVVASLIPMALTAWWMLRPGKLATT